MCDPGWVAEKVFRFGVSTAFLVSQDTENTKERIINRVKSEKAQKIVVEFGLITCETIPSKAVLHTRTRQGVKLVHQCRDQNDGVKAQYGGQWNGERQRCAMWISWRIGERSDKLYLFTLTIVDRQECR